MLSKRTISTGLEVAKFVNLNVQKRCLIIWLRLLARVIALGELTAWKQDIQTTQSNLLCFGVRKVGGKDSYFQGWGCENGKPTLGKASLIVYAACQYVELPLRRSKISNAFQ